MMVTLEVGITRMRTILVVDDCPDVAALEADLVVDGGRRAIIAANGVEALTILEDSHVDLVILDLDMPRLSGQSVLDRLAADPHLGHIPVIVVSGNLLALRPTPQVVGMISKPFDVLALQALIDRVSQTRRLPTVGRAVAGMRVYRTFATIVRPVSSTRTWP
jgi:two-component system cell cycle response regulator